MAALSFQHPPRLFGIASPLLSPAPKIGIIVGGVALESDCYPLLLLRLIGRDAIGGLFVGALRE
jgi:hypothetical protein